MVKTYRAEKFYRSFHKVGTTSTSVTTSTKKLRAKWSVEFAKDLQSFHIKGVVDELTKGINQEIIESMK